MLREGRSQQAECEGTGRLLLKQNQKWMLRAAVRAGLSAGEGPGRVIQVTGRMTVTGGKRCI